MCKKSFYLKFFSAAFLLITAFSNFAKAEDKLLDILQSEVNREFAVLKNQEVPVYYLSYRVEEVNSYNVNAEFGVITHSETEIKQPKILTVMVRTGSPQLDNFHSIRDRGLGGSSYNRAELPLNADADAVRNIVWRATNEAYKDAITRFSNVKSNISVKVEEEDKSADFTMDTPNIYEEKPLLPDTKTFDIQSWGNRVKNYSKEFLKDSAIFYGASTANYTITRKYFISSNGDRISQNTTSARVTILGYIKAKDGMELPLFQSFQAYKPERLPSDKEMQKQAEILVKNLTQLKNAPIAEPFTGPAILSAEASGVFFHEIFGHRVEGQRLKSEEDAQTFKKKIGELVLPKSFSVYCDPLQKNYNGVDLNGYYSYDDQGSKAERVNIVENGVLKNFLMSRTPIKGFPKTNGHGRAQAGMQPVTRQSNLIIETSEPKTTEELRQELIRLCKEQKLAYGYLFKDVLGGFTTTGRYSPSAFNVTPTLVYRVYTDGRSDEMVRGVDLIGTPLSMFSQIDMAGGEKGVFNGVCGAESGGVPVSGCSPNILVKVIETQKKSKSQDRPYILPRPTDNN